MHLFNVKFCDWWRVEIFLSRYIVKEKRISIWRNKKFNLILLAGLGNKEGGKYVDLVPFEMLLPDKVLNITLLFFFMKYHVTSRFRKNLSGVIRIDTYL